MPTKLVHIIVLFGSGIALVAAWIAILHLWIRWRRPVNRYSEGHPDYWRHSIGEYTRDIWTMGNFKARYRVKGSLERVDNYNFWATQMLEPRNQNSPVVTFTCQFVQVRWHPYGQWFLRYDWTANGLPVLSAYRFDSSSGECQEIYDPNCSDLMSVARTEASTIDSRGVYCGCQVSLLAVEKVFDDALTEENYKMITPEQHAVSEQYLEYQRFKEAAVIKALKLRLDLEQQVTVHQGRHVTIATTVVGTAVILRWELAESSTRDGDRLLGFRKDDGFCNDDEDNLDDTGKHGLLIIDSASNGSSTDHPSPGRTHYYTFFLRKRKKDGLHPKYSLVKFAIPVPATNDLAALKAMLESAQKAISRENDKREKLGTLLDRVNYKMEMEKKLLLTAKQMIDQINADPKFSPEERKALVDAVSEETAWVRRQL